MNNIFDTLNSSLTKESVADILRNFGFEAHPRRNFRLRDDDSNPSASIFIHKSGIPMIKDFGGDGFVGDIFKTLKVYAGVPYKDSVEYVKNYLGISHEDSSLEKKLLQKYVKRFNVMERNTESLTQEEIERRWEKLYPLKTLNNKKFKESISKLVPFDYFNQAKSRDKKEFLERVRYSSYTDDVAVKALTPDGGILAYKYRRWKNRNGDVIKWMALKGSPANKYSQIRIINPSEPVFIIEGYHDYINAVLTDINFIAIPYKHYKDFKEEELKIFENGKFDFILIQDYDFDEKSPDKLAQKIKDSEKQAEALNKALAPFSKEGKIFVWKNIREKFKDLKNKDKIKDFSDAICEFPFKSPVFFKKRLIYMAKETLNKKNFKKNKKTGIKKNNNAPLI